jgi:PIN domain nuclease of toxin-antitoxin system
VSHDAVAVLDASALLALFQDEPGAATVADALGKRALMSAANWAEVLSKLSDAGEAPDGVAQRLEREGVLGTALVVVPLDHAQAMEIARLRVETRPEGLSLGDRACLALGRATRLPVLTTDRAWADLGLADVTVKAVR